jgi:hypothetical protein
LSSALREIKFGPEAFLGNHWRAIGVDPVERAVSSKEVLPFWAKRHFGPGERHNLLI